MFSMFVDCPYCGTRNLLSSAGARSGVGEADEEVAWKSYQRNHGQGRQRPLIGDAWIDSIVRGEGTLARPRRHRPVRARCPQRVACPRRGQTVHVTEGVGRIQARGGEVIEMRAGDTVHTPPGEWHWHGAAPDRFMTHLAIFEASAEGAESEWGEQVSEAEYRAEPQRAR